MAEKSPFEPVQNTYPLYELVSKVTITDQFDTRYMEIFRKYEIHAKLVNKINQHKIK